jgi:hypothetical protein
MAPLEAQATPSPAASLDLSAIVVPLLKAVPYQAILANPCAVAGTKAGSPTMTLSFWVAEPRCALRRGPAIFFSFQFLSN